MSDDPDKLPLEYPGLEGLSWVSAREMDELAKLFNTGPRWTPAMLEVGTAAGVTAAVLADRVPHGHVTCVDTFNVNDDPTMADSDPDRWRKWKANARPNMNLWLGDLDSFYGLCKQGAFDPVFVDADHTFAHTLMDLKMAAKLVHPGCPVAVHDMGNPAWPEVTQAVEKFCRTSGWHVVNSVGSLAVLREKK